AHNLELGRAANRFAAQAVMPRAPQSSAWEMIANMPVAAADMTAATDPATGKVYVVGGSPATTAGYVFDPAAESWSALAPMHIGRAGAVAAFIDGKLYVANGWSGTSSGDPVAQLGIYDPATGTWSLGAPNPLPSGGGSAGAVVNGSLYLVGGCV